VNAELLREAAAKIRVLAEKATPGPWWLDSYVEDGEEIFTDDVLAPSSEADIARGADHVQELGSLFPPANAAHAASWHPAVALAVAEWLESAASDWESDFASMPAHLNSAGLANSRNCRALAVARAYLGTDAGGAA
jgi:hypothetical protein